MLVLFVLITFAYAMFQGGFVSWFLFYSFLPFAVYGLAVMLHSLNEFEVERRLSKSDFAAGEVLEVTITLKRKSSFPLFYLVFEDHLMLTSTPPEQRKMKFVTIPGLKKEFSYRYTVLQLPRGEHVFASYQLKTGDLLGLVEKAKKFDLKNKIIVYPAYTELHYQPFGNQFDQGMALSRERVQRDTSMAVGVRDYQPGDRFSWINWKASAKRNEMMTKEFEQRQTNDVSVVMDCSSDPRFEAIVSFTASLLRSILKKGSQTGMLTVSKQRSAFPIRGGESHLQSLFYHLAKIQPDPRIPSIDKVLEAENFHQQRVSSLLLVTAQLTKPLIEKISVWNQRTGAVTIFLVKGKRERPTNEEITLKTMAAARGVRVIFIHEGKEAEAFSEVAFR